MNKYVTGKDTITESKTFEESSQNYREFAIFPTSSFFNQGLAPNSIKLNF